METPDHCAAEGSRITSVDTLRGLTIFLMVFVNDLGPGAPSWMHHIQPPDADGMTLADIVFPFFLFIVGVSIPLALERAERAGLSTWIAARPHPDPHRRAPAHGSDRAQQRGGRSLGGHLWGLLARHRRDPGLVRRPSRARLAAKRVDLSEGPRRVSACCVLLVDLSARARPAEIPFRGTVSDWAWLRTGWWGILGLIGWAYLTVSLLAWSWAAAGMADGVTGDPDSAAPGHARRGAVRPAGLRS